MRVKRRLETDQVRAAFFGVDVVREGKHVFGIAVVVLKRDLQNHFRLFDLHIDRLVQRRFGFVQMLDERDDAALVLEDLFFAGSFRSSFSVISRPLFKKASSRSRCASTSKLNSNVSKIWPSGLNVTFVPRRLVLPVILSGASRFAALVPLFEHLAVLPDLQLEPFRERIDHRDADTVQPAGHRIGALLELAAGMQDGQRHFGGRLLLRGMHAGRNTAAVVDRP